MATVTRLILPIRPCWAIATAESPIQAVDLMFDSETGQHYILEVNSSPQLATGAVTNLKLKAYTDYLVELANGRAVD